MARTVQDVPLMLSAIAGPDPRSPISITEPGTLFQRPLERSFKGVRVAWSRDLGCFPVDPRVTEIIENQLQVFSSLGCLLDEDHPDFTDADEIFKVWRAWRFEVNLSYLLKTHRGQIKDTLVYDIERGMNLTGPQIGRAELRRTELYHRVRKFMDNYEFLLLPVNRVPLLM